MLNAFKERPERLGEDWELTYNVTYIFLSTPSSRGQGHAGEMLSPCWLGKVLVPPPPEELMEVAWDRNIWISLLRLLPP